MEKRTIRYDGIPKVTGSLHYLTDLTFRDTLYGKILRSPYPHARILSIHTEKAKQLPGVKAVLTYADVPAVNGYGIIVPDHPVFCETHVRYVGDAVAAVAAVSVEVAKAALVLIEVEYEELPVLDSPKKALEPQAIKLHPEGNILHVAHHQKGDIGQGFADAAAIVEETYELPRQMHAYMETEGGTVVPEADGGITVYMGTQHGFKDRFQLARILGIPEQHIRIVSSPMGGSFGGKDELNLQPYAALLALKTGRPVKIHHTRMESVRAGLKRHPMKITVRTGADQMGCLTAHHVEIIADTGPYTTLGPAILDFAVEHAVGPYRIPHVLVNGKSVFTNNANAGEFRGFGGNQMTFALEGQMDRLADKLGMCPVELRRRNLRRADDLGPLEQRIVPTDGARLVLERLAETTMREHTTSSRKRVGTGFALTMHGGGLGYGRLDRGGGRLCLTKEGKIEAAFGFEEAGQGILTVIETMMLKAFQCGRSDLDIQIGDTGRVPPTGSTTASRGTSMVWTAIERLKEPFTKALLDQAMRATGIEEKRLQLGAGGVYEQGTLVIDYKSLARFSEMPLCLETSFDFPTSPDPTEGGHYLYTFAAVKAKVEVDRITGRVQVLDLKQAVAAGPVVNELGYRGQIEGGGVMALGYALMEEAIMEQGKYATENFDTYMIPSIKDVPFDMETEAIETLEQGDCYGPRGVGEIGTVAVAPAIAKAIHQACGCWVAKLPVSPERLLEAMEEREEDSWRSHVLTTEK